MTTREVAGLLGVRIDCVRNSLRAVGFHHSVWSEEDIEKLKELIEKEEEEEIQKKPGEKVRESKRKKTFRRD